MSALNFKKFLRFIKSRLQLGMAALRPSLIYGLSHGGGCRIFGDVIARVVDGGSCVFGQNVVIERFSEITASGGNILIGSNTFIGQGSIVVAKYEINIGHDCLIAENVTIRDQNHLFGPELLFRSSGFVVDGVKIGDNVWIGAKACILAGVKIGSGSVVGAGSVVTKNLPPNSVAVGNPARVIRAIKG
jgi:acetyltransferase-like isoleucine patch superfamily enzyme